MDFSVYDVFIVVGVILLMLIPGYALKKKGMVSSQAISSIAVILLYVCQPLLTLKAFLLSPVLPSKELSINMAIIFVLTFVIHLIGFLFVKLIFLKQKNKLKTGAYMICSLFSNASFIGIPFVDLLTHEPLAVIYATVFTCVFNMLIWTLGIYLITGDIKKMRPIKSISNPAVVVLVLALPLFFIPELNFIKKEEMLAESITFFAGATLPLSMLIVGMRLADIPLKSLFNKPVLYVVASLKLIVIPSITFLLLFPFLKFNIFSSYDPNNYIILVLVMLMAIPPAASAIAMSERFEGEVNDAVVGFILSTLLSIISLPIFLSLLLNIISFY